MATLASGPRAVERYDPGADALARYPDWVIRHRPIGVPELMCIERKVILLDDAQSWRAKRSSLAHAVAHLDLQHVVIGGHLGDRQESEAERLAALRMVSIPALADAIRWHGENWPQVADELQVDDRMLTTRLDHLHPSNRAELVRLLAGRQLELTT